MSKEQIYKMAKDICLEKQNCNEVCNPTDSCTALKYAERAYEEGYRKQSEPFSCGQEKGGEWISVEERSPERDTNVLAYSEKYEEIGVYHHAEEDVWWDNEGWASAKYYGITHWMPLPEEPRKEDDENENLRKL